MPGSIHDQEQEQDQSMMDAEREPTPPGNPILLEEKHIVVVRLFSSLE
jgi:hypothetical protein